MTPELSIIIVSYNVRSYLQKCIASIVNAKIKNSFEIIVIDNKSTDQTPSIILAKYPEIIWIQNEQNIGFAAANNQGIKISKGQFILLLNPDTEVMPGAIEALNDVMTNNPSVGACGSKLINPDGSLQRSCYPFPSLGNEFIRLHHLENIFPHMRYPMDQWNNQQFYPVDNIQGASLLLRKEAIQIIGPLDESFFVYTEEVDLNYRLKKAGWENVYVPSSVVVHYGAQSTKQNKTEMFLELYKTKIQFFRKHYGAVKTNFYKLILFETSLMRILLGNILNIFQKTGERQTLINNYANLIKKVSSY